MTFEYKNDPAGTRQFGLIAQEVADVNPDLMVRDTNGQTYTVRYDAVKAMLLNEFLKEHKAFVEQQQKVEQQRVTIAQQQKQIEVLTVGLQRMHSSPQRVRPWRT